MARVYVKIDANDIKKAVREKGVKKIIALTKNPQVLKQIAEKAGELVRPYVPKKSGALRDSFHIVSYNKLTWGDYTIGSNNKPTYTYADEQYTADDSNWRRTTPGTESYWTKNIERGTPGFEELIEYVEPLIKKEVQKND